MIRRAFSRVSRHAVAQGIASTAEFSLSNALVRPLKLFTDHQAVNFKRGFATSGHPSTAGLDNTILSSDNEPPSTGTASLPHLGALTPPINQKPSGLNSQPATRIPFTTPTVTPQVFKDNLQRFNSGLQLSGEVFADLYQNSSENGVFANADCPLNHVHAWGFDYDYTITNYSTHAQRYIYKMVAEALVKQKKYPEKLLTLDFDENFCVRGLLFDSKTGFLMKLDQYNKIQTDTVFYGRERVPVSRVVEAYDGVTMTRAVRARCTMFADLFAVPEMCLLADVIQLFKDAGTRFDPSYVMRDVREAVSQLHISGQLHSYMVSNPDLCFERVEGLGDLLLELKRKGRMVFLLTNSPFHFVDQGMRYILGDFLKAKGLTCWRELFDIVIVSAMKPHFYTRMAAFRKINLDNEGPPIDYVPVQSFKKGEVYTEGCLTEFTRLTGINGRDVLYIGDHVMNDLAEPTQEAVWRSCAVIKEIGREAKITQSEGYQTLLRKLLTIEALVAVGQGLLDEVSRAHTATLRRQRDRVRAEMREIFNPNFGSVFRTNSNRSLFFFELCKHADIYTSSIGNFLNYPLDFIFYAIRTAMPHEGPLSWPHLFSSEIDPETNMTLPTSTAEPSMLHPKVDTASPSTSTSTTSPSVSSHSSPTGVAGSETTNSSIQSTTRSHTIPRLRW